ncbi:MAG: penicillin-binding protein 2 [Bacteroidota bacterium]|nr:penicillin-binding protein 2 [Bacteroidota bacterium]
MAFRGNSRRKTFVGVMFFGAFAILGYRMFQLQFFEYDEFRTHAERNSIRCIEREPMRGLILDANGNILVNNQPIYTLTITPFEFREESIPLVSSLFELDSGIVRKALRENRGTAFEPVKILRDLTFEKIALLEENRSLLPGVGYIVENRRVYTAQTRMSHLLGYIKEISPALLARRGPYYKPGDMIGYTGIESYYEDVLRGRKGYEYFTVDARGKVIERFEQGKADQPAVEGADLVLTIDMKLQEYAERLLRNRRGAIVALDVNNGEVKAFASAPDYDLRTISQAMTAEQWRILNENEGHPLYNRCSMAAYPPGSTFKMMLAAAALQERIIDASTTIPCPGSYTLAGVTFKCHGAHGNIDVVRAIEYSCNVFFYKLIFKLGFALWAKYGSMFHFGRPTGIDIAHENPGVLPDESYYNRRYGRRWNKGYLVSLGIGQGEISTTPLQMAAFTATIANGGTYYRPHVVRSIIDRAGKGKQDIPILQERLPLDPEVWRVIRKGMFLVVHGSGTGYAARTSSVHVAGKTGTAQNPHGRDHAWFVGYAPAENPKIAVAVIIENGGWGGEAAAPIAGAILRYGLLGPVVPASVTDTTEVEAAKPAKAERPAHILAD